MTTKGQNKVNVITSEKSIVDNKKEAIAKSIAKVKNSNSDIFANLDFKNIESQIAKIKVSERSDKKLMYTFERSTSDAKEQKKLRQKIRNERNKYADKIILCAQKKDSNLLKTLKKDFETFYKKEYILNDYSLQSLSSNNRDKETETKLNLMLQILKLV